MNFPSLKKTDVKNKTVLLRSDFDVPLQKTDSGYLVADDFRMFQALPTIRYLISQSAKTVILSHLGRPEKRDWSKSLLPVAEHLAGLLHYKFMEISSSVARLPHYQLPHVFLITEDPTGKKAKEIVSDLNEKDVAIFENLRFHPEEKSNNVDFSKKIAELGDIYVNDAFAVSHREQASVTGVPKFLPHFAGLELLNEVSALEAISRRPKRPYVLMVGGIKLSDKLEGLRGMMEKIDHVIVGGGLASLFFEALGFAIGRSVIDKKSLPATREILRNFRDKILLPSDVLVAPAPQDSANLRVCNPDKISPQEMVLDIGPETIKKFSAVIKTAKTIVWSGPMGLFEVEKFSHGTKALGWLVASRGSCGATVVAGGGDTMDAVKMVAAKEDFSFLSTGGSAMLQFLSGKKMPGIEALKA